MRLLPKRFPEKLDQAALVREHAKFAIQLDIRLHINERIVAGITVIKHEAKDLVELIRCIRGAGGFAGGVEADNIAQCRIPWIVKAIPGRVLNSNPILGGKRGKFAAVFPDETG